MITLALVAFASFVLGIAVCASVVFAGVYVGAKEQEFTAAYFDSKSNRWKVIGDIFPISHKVLYQTIRHGPGSIK